MTIPEYIIIKDKDGKITAYLSPKADNLKDCYPDARLNGESTLEFQLPATSEKIEELTPECQIWAGGRVYSLLNDESVDTIMDESGKLWTKFMAIERWNDLDNQFAEPYLTNDPTTPPTDLSVKILSGGDNLSGGLYFTGSAAHAMYAILQYSDWNMGVVDVPGIHDLEVEKVSILQVIKQIQEIWGGYLVWDSENKVVHLRSGDTWQSYTGFQIRYAKNMKHITRTQSNRIVTKLYAFGADDLDIASVNDGKKYVENHSFTSRNYVDIYSNPDIYDPQELKEKAEAELALRCKPRYNYKTKMVDLRTLPEYSHEDFSLGDMADILNEKLDITDKARIIRHKYNLFQPWQCELELGDPEERLVEKLKASFDTSNFIDNTFKSTGNISGKKLVDGTVIGNKIAKAALDASKFNTKQIILTNDVWTDNSPSSGYVSWNSHKLFYAGVEYTISAGNTNKKYIVWRKDISSTQYQTYTEQEFANVTLADYDFVIAVNNGGIHDIAWYNRLARQFIGSAFIAEAAIKTAHIAEAQIVDAHISNLSVSKLTSGIITADNIYVGSDQKFWLSGANQNLVVNDGTRDRVIVGKNGSDYGIWVKDSSGGTILSASGLGVNVVGNEQILDNSIESVKIKSLSADLINAVEGIVLGANATITWEELPSLPNAEQVGAKPYDWVPGISDVTGLEGRLTYIDGQGIYTGTLTAQQINAIQGIQLGSNAIINWNEINRDPKTDDAYDLADDAYSYAGSAYSRAGTAIGYTQQLASGTYTGPYSSTTFINGTTVYSPVVRGGYVVGTKLFAVNNPNATISGGDISGYKRLIIDNNGIVSYNDDDELDGIRINANDGFGTIRFYYNDEPRGHLQQSGGSIFLKGETNLYIRSGTKTYIENNVSFANATSIDWGNHAPVARFK